MYMPCTTFADVPKPAGNYPWHVHKDFEPLDCGQDPYAPQQRLLKQANNLDTV